MESIPLTRQPLPSSLVRDHVTGLSVSVLIITLTLYIPLLGFFLAILLPMPIVFYRLKLGRNQGAVLMALVFGITTAITGAVSVDMLFYGGLLLTGFLLGEFIELRYSVEKLGIYTCLATVGICVTAVFLYSWTLPGSLGSLVSAYVAANLDLTLKLYKEMGMSQESIDIIAGSLDTIQYVLVSILPALCISFVMFVTWANILFIKTVLARKGINLPQLAQLNQWQAPERLVWLVIGFGLSLLIQVKGLSIIGLNCLIVLMLIYFFQGIAIVSFFFEKKRFPMFLKLFIYSIIAVQQLFLFLVVGIGFFDTWINFRKLGVPDAEED